MECFPIVYYKDSGMNKQMSAKTTQDKMDKTESQMKTCGEEQDRVRWVMTSEGDDGDGLGTH